MKKMSKTLTRQYFDIKDARFADKTSLENGVLSWLEGIETDNIVLWRFGRR